MGADTKDKMGLKGVEWNAQTISRRVLGIDPGLANTGWAVVARKRSGKFVLMESGCIVTSSRDSEGARLLHLYQQVTELYHVHAPNCVAIERVFHNKNISSSLSTAAVVGVCQLAAEQMGLEIQRFTPQQVKVSAVCGPGGVEKAIVKKFVSKLTGVLVTNGHASDAAGAAIAGLLQSGSFCGR